MTTRDFFQSCAYLMGTLTATLGITTTYAQPVGIGLHKRALTEGFSLVTTPYNQGANLVGDLFQDIGDGFQVIKFDGTTWSTNTFTLEGTVWFLPTMTLSPGEGALINSPTAYDWIQRGQPTTGPQINVLPSGTSMRGSVTAVPGTLAGNLNVPLIEDLEVRRVQADGAFTTEATYRNGKWTPKEPSLDAGEAFLFVSPTQSLWEQAFLATETEPPFGIAQQPASLSAAAGVDVELSVTLTEGSTSVRYQWQRNGNNLPGATQSTFSIASATLTDSGSYGVLVFTDAFTVRSDLAVLEIAP